MCGIIGFISDRVTENQMYCLRTVMTESRIRGMHASGVMCYINNKKKSMVIPEPIDILVKKLDWASILGCKVSLIAHARYSTSDIQYNQPIIDKGTGIAIVHNGVVSQSPPEQWEQQFGYKTQTKNDSELLLRCIIDGKDPLKVFPESSIAALVLNKDHSIRVVRNGLRPLWTGKVEDAVVYASTFDILSRAGVEPHKVDCSGIEKQLYSNHNIRTPILI